ncbi:hypothetical protein [Actibacterium sp. MT2.3-13A]|uniref:hypothetical protein n=1 Tax=Actibacterium sp. MT2.3-13A TaxID=2828332 RepID=UPI001BAC2C09|nr:hypothetical protein [Actibacterium sp. MT2.3-13A]
MTVVRVILSATSFAEARDALALATEIAAEMNGDLQGLLIEQEAVVTLTRLPAARLIGSHGRALGGIDPAGMAAAFRGDARRFEAELARAAEAAALRWSFRHKRGQVGEILEEMLQAGTLLVACGAPRRAPLREVVLVLGADGDMALARLAAAQAARIGRPLRLLLPPGAEPPPDLAPTVIERFADEPALRARIAALDPRSLLFAEAGSLAKIAQEARCTCILRVP